MTPTRFGGLGRTAQGAAASLLFALVCLLAGAFQVAPAAAACPNEVFRTGPSAKLPECRAYELVTPPYTGGAIPTATNFWNVRNVFDWQLITAGGDSVIYNTIAGPLTGTPGNGETDRYRAKRTPQGWMTEFIGTSAQESPHVVYGGVSADHQYYFVQAGSENDFVLLPGASLLAPFGGGGASFIRKPNGEFELIAKGSLGSARKATGYLITPGATHVVFSTDTKLEPQAPPSGKVAIYDRSVGGPTHVVSLLPGDVTPTEGETFYLGASEDVHDIAFAQVKQIGYDTGRFYVRHGNTTQEVARSNGAVVGRKLTCEGTGGTSTSYQWLRNGAPIAGATSATYTVAQADEGDALQCQVAASSSEGESFQASLPPVVVEPYEGIDPPFRDAAYYELAVHLATPQAGFSAVGEAITCEPEGWTQSPTYSYQWFRNGTEIGGATDATYTPVGADEETGLQCRLTASNADGAAIAFSSVVPVHPVPLTETADPAVSNLTDPGTSPEAGDELSCSQGTWNGSPTLSYQWLRSGAAIGGETSSTYTVAPADAGATLQCVVSGATGGVTTQAISNRLVAEPQPGTAPPEPDTTFGSPGMIFGGFGGAPVGEALFCSGSFQWSGEPTVGFQWLRDGAEIAGATEEAYVPTQADVGATLQCRVTATNAGGTTVATYAGADAGPRVVSPAFPVATSQLPPMSLAYGGIFGGNVFYGDRPGFGGVGMGSFQAPSDLYSYSIADGTTTRITDVGDARFSFVSKDGSRVYFLSTSEIGGEGIAGEQNLYLWSRADGSTKLIATAGPEDAYQLGLGRWTEAVVPNSGQGERGLGAVGIRESADGSTLLFTTTAQLSSFDNVEAAPEDCGQKFSSGDRCAEIYRYELASGNLTCVSCPPGSPGPATGAALLQGGPLAPYAYNTVPNVMADGKTVFFQSNEDLLPQDGNQYQDVYRWKEGAGLALISTGQQPVESVIYGITPNGSDVSFVTSEPLVPEDENGGSHRIYDARVNGGFPPPEGTVTEPCSGDACQGNPKAAPEAPGTPSASLNGGGNVHPKLRCPKGKRRVVRHGKQRCVKRGHHRKHKRRHARANQGAAR